MATPTEKCQPWLHDGDPCEMKAEKIAAAQTFGVGAPLQKKDGQVLLAEDCASNAANCALYGFAYAAAAAPDEDTEIYVAQINADQLWAMWVATGGTDTACALDIMGDTYGHAVEATSPFKGYMTLDLGYTTYMSWRVMNVMSNLDTKIVASVSTAPGVAICRVLQSALDVVSD